MAIAAEILTILKANASQFKAEIAGAQGTTESFAGGLSKTAVVGGAAFAALGAAAVAVAVVGVKAAQDYETAHARLVTAIANSGSTWKAQGDRVEELDSKMRNLGFTDTDTEGSLSKLVAVTKNTTESTKLMGLAADIARGRHIDLASATDILVKVEAGRVGLLGRLGIQTKDATGATISQEEAIKRLTALYGGQASAYTETFAGRIDQLEAQLDHIAVTIGEAVIPVITAMAGALADTISFFEHNKAAALTLAIVIGGPLVYALGAFAVAAAGAAVSSLVASWIGLVGAASKLAQSILEAVTALGLFGTLGVAAMLAVAAAIVYFGSTDGVFERNGAAAKAWADKLVAGAQASGKELMVLKTTHASLSTEIDNNKKHIEDLQQNYAKYGLTIDQANEKALQLGYATDLLQQKNKIVTDTIKTLNAEHAKQVVATQAVATAYGVDLPAAFATLDSKSQKALQNTIANASQFFSSTQIGSVLAVGAIKDAGNALQSAADQSKTFADSIEGSIAKFTDVFAHFGDQATVGADEMTQFFVGSQLQAAAWADEVTALIHTGVDQGIIQEVAKAGPGSKPALDQFLALVQQNGADWANSVYESGQKAAQYTEAAFNQMAITAAIKSLEIKTVSVAQFKDMQTGGTTELEKLLHSTDTNMAAMAYGALLQLGTIRAAAAAPFPDVSIGVVVNDGPLDALEARLNHIASTDWKAVISAVGGI